ncbi:D-2-hydroxyacid dehydrogenase [Oscillospiraceae bacterium MB08-C2-2]|nr:D-2-hydroxyacid dehydrogenase [Oscillospiraceae bacterium MB08-C2-2]
MKIVILDGYTENPGDLSWEGFEKLGELTVYDRTPLSDEAEILSRIGDAEIVITNKTPLSAKVISSAPNIKYIGVLATGYNVVDTAAAKEHGIAVTNIPTYGTAAVGQFAIALLLEICHHIGHHNAAVKKGRWTASPDFCFWDYPLIELAGKTMGIIGFGRIGQCTGQIAKAMGMKVLAYDEYPNDTGRAIAEYVSLDELYAQSDVISLHCPLFPSTEGMINRKSIAQMKDGVIILNNSRGPLIVEADLAAALEGGKVYAAGLDVVSSEPIQADNVLLAQPNCIITPHISWAPKESRSRLMDIAVDNLNQFLAGTPVNVVNK